MVSVHVCSIAKLIALPFCEDNLSLTRMESLFCGTPVVTSNTTGLSSMTKREVIGYLADIFDVNDFERGIKCLIDNSGGCAFGKSARAYDRMCIPLNVIVNQHLNIYKRVLV